MDVDVDRFVGLIEKSWYMCVGEFFYSGFFFFLEQKVSLFVDMEGVNGDGGGFLYEGSFFVSRGIISLYFYDFINKVKKFSLFVY